MSAARPSGGPPVIVQLVAQQLTKEKFAPFGEVIQNPLLGGDSFPTQQLKLDSSEQNLVEALARSSGYGSVHINISALDNFYGRAPSRKSAQAVLQVATYEPEQSSKEKTLDESEDSASNSEQRYEVHALQRHPFTAKTVVPVGVSVFDRTTQYLIIVAPTLPPSRKRRIRPPPFPPPEPRRRRSVMQILSRARPPPFPENPAKPMVGSRQKPRLPGPGLPDLQNARAFIANASQAVTYGPGVWHAPVMILGTTPVQFVTVQFCNGVPQEDQQAIHPSSIEEQAGLTVLLAPNSPPKGSQVAVKAKL